jgi:tetratricopeptide (TPR) repeat protein
MDLPSQVSFNEHVAPITFGNCTTCHRPGGSAPFSLLTYEDVRAHASEVVEATEGRFMPPWQPEPGWGELRGERRLSDREVALIRRWLDDGTPEGDPGDLPQPPAITEGWQLGAPDLVVQMQEVYTLPAEGVDVFRNFVIPVPIDERRYVKHIAIRPSPSRLVHHVMMLVDESRASRRLDEEDPGPGYSNGMEFTEAYIPDGHFLGWTPGAVPFEGSDDLAWRLDRGTDLVMQLHMLPTGKPEPLQVAVGLYFSETPPTRAAVLLQLGSRTIDIPAGEAAHVIEDEYRLPVDVDVLSVYPHAHYLGKDMQVVAVLPDGSERRLLWISNWDWKWQDSYRYATPVSLPSGSSIRMRYTYDNSADNPQNRSNPPRRVRYGPLASDEMGDLWVQVLPRSGRARATLAADFARNESLKDFEAAQFAVQIDPGDFWAQHNLGAALQAQGRHDEAIDHLREALRLKPDHAVSHYNLGIALEALGDPEEAMSQYRDTLSIRPDYVEARVNLGVTLGSFGRVGEAIIEFNSALRDKPDDVQAHNNLGVALLSIGRVELGVGHFREALRTNPDHVEANNNLGVVLLSTGSFEDAATHFRQALQSKPDYVEAHNNLGAALGSLGRFADAAGAFRNALRVKPDDAGAHNNLGTALEALDQLDAAIASYRQALQLRPDYEEAQRNLERALAKRESAPG